MSRHRPSAASTQRISIDDDGTDDEDLGFDPKKPKAGTSKLDLFDDILGGTVNEAKRPATASSIAPQLIVRQQPPAISRQSTETTENSTAPRLKTSAGRRGSATINPDIGGIFNTPAKELSQSSIAPKKRGSSSDWLGLKIVSEPSEIHSDTRTESPKTKPREKSQTVADDNLKLNDALDTQDATAFALPINDPISSAVADAHTMFQLNGVNLETRWASTMLQQQESQLTMATQMKQQERALMEMQRKQETLLQKQERQFENLLQQQMQRQQALEENIKFQQQRINAHIQLMLTQPVNYCMPINHEDSNIIALHEKHALQKESNVENEKCAASLRTADQMQIESDSWHLNLEKKRLEELLESTKANYQKEIDAIQSSNKKQIKLLEEHAEALEFRLRAEISAVTEFYTQKIAVLEEEQLKSKRILESELSTLKQDHEEEMRRLRRAHEEELIMLRDEQRRMIEAIQHSKKIELSVIQGNDSYLDTLKAASANLSEATVDLQSLQEQLHKKIETTNLEREKTLEARERSLADKERLLKIKEASAEEDKERLMKLVANLEQQLITLNKEAGEENWQLRLKLSALEADKIAFEREKECVRAQMQRDEQRLASMKADQIAEIQRVKLELQEERRQLQLQKTCAETQQKLRENKNDSVETERLDLEVAMKYAHDAARQAYAERQRYFSQQSELAQLKRDLIEKEAALSAKHEQIQREWQTCASVETHAKDAIKRARLIEQTFQEKLLELQRRARDLAEKESYLAEERQLLTQERIAIKEALSKKNFNQEETTVIRSLDGTPLNTQAQKTQMFVVDKLLDDNIAESLKRLEASIGKRSMTNLDSSTSALSQDLLQQNDIVLKDPDLQLRSGFLDDDSKSLALSNYLKLK